MWATRWVHWHARRKHARQAGTLLAAASELAAASGAVQAATQHTTLPRRCWLRSGRSHCKTSPDQSNPDCGACPQAGSCLPVAGHLVPSESPSFDPGMHAYSHRKRKFMNLSSTKKSTSAQVLNEPFEGASTQQLVQASQAGQNNALLANWPAASNGWFTPSVSDGSGNHTEAQEVTQEVLIKAYEKLDQLENRRLFPAGCDRSRYVNRSTGIPAGRLVWRSNPRCSTHRITATRRRWTVCWPMSGEDQLHAGLQNLEKLDRNTLEVFYAGAITAGDER